MREWCVQFISQGVNYHPDTRTNIFDELLVTSSNETIFKIIIGIIKNGLGRFYHASDLN